LLVFAAWGGASAGKLCLWAKTREAAHRARAFTGPLRESMGHLLLAGTSWSRLIQRAQPETAVIEVGRDDAASGSGRQIHHGGERGCQLTDFLQRRTLRCPIQASVSVRGELIGRDLDLVVLTRGSQHEIDADPVSEIKGDFRVKDKPHCRFVRVQALSRLT
jgi:hypothetical protein